jgi:hypothetical protein
MFFGVWLLITANVVFAEKTGVKIDDIHTGEDTSITIQKGTKAGTCIVYNIIDGTEEVFGSPEHDRSKAYVSWKTACTEWKREFREINKDNSILSYSCNQPAMAKDGDLYNYKATASYKIKVRMQEMAK